MTVPSVNELNARRGVVIGDIHGCHRAFRVLIENLDLKSDDFVVVLGDAVDRGPNSRDVLDQMIRLRQKCELIYILGNHEEMMLSALKGRDVERWLRHGGAETLGAYDGDLKNIPSEHIQLLKSTVRYWEGPTEICVHANLEPGVPLERQRSAWLRWNKLTGQEFPHSSGKRVICGHSGVNYGAPTVNDGWICLATLVYEGGVLSAIDLASLEIIQTRQKNAEIRRGVYLWEL